MCIALIPFEESLVKELANLDATTLQVCMTAVFLF